jgi:hypothetical protein
MRIEPRTIDRSARTLVNIPSEPARLPLLWSPYRLSLLGSPYSGHHTVWACPAPNKNGLSTEKDEWVETKFHHLFVLNWSCGISGVWCVSVRLCRLCTQMYAALPTFGVQCVLCWPKILNRVPCRLAIRRTFWCFTSHNKTNKSHMSHLLSLITYNIPNILVSYPDDDGDNSRNMLVSE